MDIAYMILAVLCGSLVGFTLGLIGGGSIMQPISRFRQLRRPVQLWI